MDWKQKAIIATRGTQLGAILCCALDHDRDAIPRFESKAVITSDGFLMANFVDKNGDGHLSAFVGGADELAKNARGLAAHLKLADSERDELFATFKGWIEQDYSGKGVGL